MLNIITGIIRSLLGVAGWFILGYYKGKNGVDKTARKVSKIKNKVITDPKFRAAMQRLRGRKD